VATILDKIIAHKREELKEVKGLKSFDELNDEILALPPSAEYFYRALSKKGGVNIIAEVKKGSPSKGIICHDFDPVRIARQYEEAGASAISVLTDEKFFFGSLEYLKDIRAAVSLPLLRKDFIIDEYQIYEAKAAGANAILLIAAVLETGAIEEFLDLTHSLGMDALLEVHNSEELEKALATKANIIGINNRNLNDFSVDLNTTKELARTIPDDKVKVSESGIHTRADIDFLLSCGVNSFLIGESLVKNGAIEEKLNELSGN
jgi:indole-3-glycerol phosphate synthase